MASTPAWVVDAKNWAGLVGAFVGAFGLVWRYAIKPYLVYREVERKRDMAEARATRAAEISVALIPVKESVQSLAKNVERTGDKLILLGDAIHGTNLRIDDFAASNTEMHAKVNERLDDLTRESQSLHVDVKAHMEAEDAKGRT